MKTTSNSAPSTTGTPSETTRGVQRRSIVKGAAWTVPVIAVATAAPAAAASTPTNCSNLITNLHATGNAWNDGANGANASGSHNGWAVYDANSSLFADLYFENNGQTTVTSLTAATSLEMGAHDSTSFTVAYLLLSDGTRIFPTSTIPPYDQDGAGLRWVFTYNFSGITLAPGQTATFRTTYATSNTVRSDYVLSRPYQIAVASGILCEGQSVSVTESDTSDNFAQVSTGYYVHG